MDRSQRVLTLAVGLSVLLHAVVLSIHFNALDRVRKLATPPTLDVVLVNAKTHKRPLKPDVLAQANVDGGGNTEENRRARSPTPVTSSNSPGDDLRQATQRVRELEAQQRQLLARTQPGAASVPTPNAPLTETSPAPTVSGRELVARSMQRLQLEAEIRRDVDAYNKIPRKLNVGVRASEYRVARYLDEWAQKVERVGNLNYPEMARGKFYGDVQISVGIKPDGSVDSFEILRSSGYPVLDRAAENIVKMSAPYAPVTAEIRREYDILVITRTMKFTRSDRFLSD